MAIYGLVSRHVASFMFSQRFGKDWGAPRRSNTPCCGFRHTNFSTLPCALHVFVFVCISVAKISKRSADESNTKMRCATKNGGDSSRITFKIFMLNSKYRKTLLMDIVGFLSHYFAFSVNSWLIPIITNQVIHYFIDDQWLMVHGSRLMTHASRLVAQGSWLTAKKKLALDPPDPALAPNFSWP